MFVALFVTGAPSIRPDTLNGGTPTSWNPNYLYNLPTYIPGLYYWNNNSGDGAQDNIGWCLVGSASCGLQNPPGPIAYYSINGNGPANMYFTSDGSPRYATLQLTMTDQKGIGNGTDLFGFYQTDATGTTILNPTVIFTSNDAIGTTYTWPPSALTAGENYAFFIENIQGIGTSNVTYYIYYMNSSLNTATGSMGPDNLQHFAVFSSGTTYYIGSVDGDSCHGNFQPGTSPCLPASQFDFNDFTVELSTSAPEPDSAILSGAGLLGGFLIRRRRTL